MEEISKKNSEIKRLWSLMHIKLNPGKKLITVILIQKLKKHYSFICKNTDKLKILNLNFMKYILNIQKLRILFF